MILAFYLGKFKSLLANNNPFWYYENSQWLLVS